MDERERNWHGWKTFFAARRNRPAPTILDDDPALDGVPGSVARSLAIFQLGESGGGTVVQQSRRSRFFMFDLAHQPLPIVFMHRVL